LRCDGFGPENYGLFSLGSLDGMDASEIASHLEQQCETCVREVRRSLAFWSAFGEVLSPSLGEVKRRNWRTILSGAVPSTAQRLRGWSQWGAVAAAVVMTSGLTGWLVSVSYLSAKRELESQIAVLQQRARELTSERDQAIRSVPAPQAAPAPVPPSAVRQLEQQDARLRQNLAGSQAELNAARRLLGDAQNQVSQLQTQLAQQQTDLAALRSQQTSLQSRAASAESNAAQIQRQIGQMQNRITQLEAERTRLVDLLEIRERQSQQNLRLVEDLANPGTRLIRLAGTESAPNARGYVLITADNRVTFYQAGLPGLPSGRTYQIWLIRNRGVPIVSGGLFNTNGAPQTEVELAAGALINNLSGVAVTTEPAGGSPLPTGNKLLIGTVRRS
jgi:anti-sigma-K factor RskA